MSHFIDRITGCDHPYVIAEAGINHNGDLELAKEMIEAARENGADCIKFQNFMTDRYISRQAERAPYQDQEAFRGKSQYEIIKACEIDGAGTEELMTHARKVGIDFLSTPFEPWSFRLLKELGVPAVKISSCNLTNRPFLEEVAQSGMPVLLSTGMADLHEVVRAVDIFKGHDVPLLLFQCTSNYPSKIQNANLRVIPVYRRMFEVPVGFSDHTPSGTAAIAAVALGAAAVEKHFTLSRDLPGIDQKASIVPSELKELVRSLHEARAALGSPLKRPADEEEGTRSALRRSLVAARSIRAGEVLREDMVSIKRPGNGLPPEFLDFLLGQTFSRDVGEDRLLALEDFFLCETS